MDDNLGKCMSEFRNLLNESNIQKAYFGLIKYFFELKNYFRNKYSENFTVGHFHQGYMDFTYFTFTPNELRNRLLKVVLVFDYKKFQFEVCLVGQNKEVQKKYWQLLKNLGWNKYQLPDSPKEVIVNVILEANPDFHNLDVLTNQLEQKILDFLNEINHIYLYDN